jgi:glycogen phosphorylase
MRSEIGEENMFIFGDTMEEVRRLRSRGYRPRERYDNDPRIRRLVDTLASTRLAPREQGIFEPIVRSLLDYGDHYLNLLDLPGYMAAQQRVSACYEDRMAWGGKSILNIARSGRFSSDRTIQEYADDIWGIASVPPEWDGRKGVNPPELVKVEPKHRI